MRHRPQAGSVNVGCILGAVDRDVRGFFDSVGTVLEIDAESNTAIAPWDGVAHQKEPPLQYVLTNIVFTYARQE